MSDSESGTNSDSSGHSSSSDGETEPIVVASDASSDDLTDDSDCESSDNEQCGDDGQVGGVLTRHGKKKLIISDKPDAGVQTNPLPVVPAGIIEDPVPPISDGTDGDVDDDDEDDDDDDDETDFLAKFDADTRRQHLLDNHPQAICPSFEEVRSLSVVHRDENGVPVDPLHRTIPILTKYEKTRVLGARASQIANGSPPYIKLTKPLLNGLLIAEMELQEQKLPFIIRRPLPNGGSEFWKLKDLAVL